MTVGWRKYAAILVPMTVVVAAPLVLREEGDTGAAGADVRLEVISPHNETIRREFGEAFAAWWKEKSGERVYVNWRTPGGTSEIKRVLDSAYEAAAAGGRDGIGIDLFFGGGEYDFSKQASLGRFEKLRVFESRKELFESGVIPATMSGERYYDPEHTWVGVCLSSFGICYNTDLVNARGLVPPSRWEDLGTPEYYRGIALADPTKSGSVAKAFEMLVQEQMQAVAKTGAGRDDVMEAGWKAGLNLIQRIGANARYFTDSASKIPHDVAQGNAVAGMCIDFYGRSFNESLKEEDGTSRLEFITPVGGSSISVDPVAVLRGAPHPELAQEFVEFLLTKRGQMIWNARVGADPGPHHRALRRLPIRRDLYEGETLAMMVDRDAMPYEAAGEFVYDGALTGHLFTALRTIVRVMCIDSHHELKAGWEALIEAGFPEKATSTFFHVGAVSYERTGTVIREALKSEDKVAAARLLNQLGRTFRANYREAARLAREGR
ncbi:MAG: extracellular solute-binding protein [Akkermansiaceae bacterium]|nr:extracellular solute-binding protein [Akkermansiaceae bacterium]